MRTRIIGPVGIIIAALAILYFTGHLDRPLYTVGLNYHECARNGLGATFCGKELDEYRARVQGITENANKVVREAETQQDNARQRAYEESQP